jgi:dTDP-3-amino-3,4,6-trideoxy-alpha-D-glucose transaminase
LQKHLENAGVQTLIHYPVPAHRSGAYNNLGIPAGSLPLCEKLSAEVLSLPISPQITKAEAVSVIEALNGWPS